MHLHGHMVCRNDLLLDIFNFVAHLINFMLCVFSFMACAESISSHVQLILRACIIYTLCVSNFRAYIVYSMYISFAVCVHLIVLSRQLILCI